MNSTMKRVDQSSQKIQQIDQEITQTTEMIFKELYGTTDKRLDFIK